MPVRAGFASVCDGKFRVVVANPSVAPRSPLPLAIQSVLTAAFGFEREEHGRDWSNQLPCVLLLPDNTQESPAHVLAPLDEFGPSGPFPAPLVFTNRAEEFRSGGLCLPDEFLLTTADLSVQSIYDRTQLLATMWTHWLPLDVVDDILMGIVRSELGLEDIDHSTARGSLLIDLNEIRDWARAVEKGETAEAWDPTTLLRTLD